MYTRRFVLGSGGLALFLAALLPLASGCEQTAVAEEDRVVTVYKSPTCGCCNGWIRHLEAAGFEVVAHDTQELSAIKSERGIPRNLDSCHTALVGGYIVEGHVPASDVTRLLKEKPDYAGIAVPGMPIGSPGMEGPNPEAYDVLGFRKDGSTEVFSSHTP